MQTYAAIDLHSNDGVLAIIDETDRVLKQRRIANKVELFVAELEPYRATLQGVEVKHLTGARITELYENEDLALALTTTLKVIDVLTEQTRVIERVVLAKARLRRELKLLLTVWGIGEILGLTIMFEAGDMNRFADPGNFASYSRCVDATRLSNGKKKADNNARNGNEYLAWAFVEAAHRSEKR